MFGRTILVLLLLWKQDSVKSVRLVELRVPTHEPEGGMALLGCQYDMEGDTLYSVKWYKDGREFYRFVPKNEPPVYYFETPGVNVDVARSSNTVVALMNLTQESAGHYRCEVSGEAPHFTTVFRQKYINIHLLPKGGPRVVGLRGHYRLDETVLANCSLPPSRPKAHLKWLVNDRPAPAEYVLGPWYRVSTDRPDAAETILQLSFYATTADFVNGAVKLKCQATIAPLYQREAESTHYIAFPFTITDPPDAEEIKDHAATAQDSIAALLIPIIFLILM
ncbi:unnamed protein product [Chrysodeixis includens]|uniref:Ig-like domain-containing protein n=1 Tax=Chrysodeixis includens TaxID=689277 RepID=A0A9P0FRJ1_CHRIL|nr:unnamed protein product [Chrysodeixis includens]